LPLFLIIGWHQPASGTQLHGRLPRLAWYRSSAMLQRTLEVRLALLGIVASLLAMESTFNSKQWHTGCPRIMQCYFAACEPDKTPAAQPDTGDVPVVCNLTSLPPIRVDSLILCSFTTPATFDERQSVTNDLESPVIG
jgi:hypothetical protein